MRVVEAFSGIGSQAKALELLKRERGLDYEIVNTIEWDVNSIVSYDIIHNGPQDLTELKDLTREDLLNELKQYSLSYNGKDLVGENHFNRYKTDALKSVYYAIKRTKNLISIKDVDSNNFPKDIDVLTYSFPCQDLSLSGFFHGDSGGIEQGANNSSSLLWEVGRILEDLSNNKKTMPKVLLMENVSSITNAMHVKNFNKWKDKLESLGYVNGLNHLNAEDFGIPQSRKRAFMISVYHGNNEVIKNRLKDLVNDNDWFPNRGNIPRIHLADILKTDYTINKYFEEAKEQVPNDTPSREKIYKENIKIIDKSYEIVEPKVRTLTTKQDRHPNSGVICINRKEFNLPKTKSKFRFITPRESFLLMGFEEEDYELLIENNFNMTNKNKFLTRFKLTKMAGNSIVVNVMKEVFNKIDTILNELEELKTSLNEETLDDINLRAK